MITRLALQNSINMEILDPFDFKSYELCKSCLLGKMTELGYRLLGIIHNDECWLLTYKPEMDNLTSSSLSVITVNLVMSI